MLSETFVSGSIFYWGFTKRRIQLLYRDAPHLRRMSTHVVGSAQGFDATRDANKKTNKRRISCGLVFLALWPGFEVDAEQGERFVVALALIILLDKLLKNGVRSQVWRRHALE